MRHPAEVREAEMQKRRHYLHERRHYRPDGDKFLVTVRVLETRNSYGTDHFLIEPLDGAGQRWTTGARLSPIQETEPFCSDTDPINVDANAELAVMLGTNQ